MNEDALALCLSQLKKPSVEVHYGNFFAKGKTSKVFFPAPAAPLHRPRFKRCRRRFLEHAAASSPGSSFGGTSWRWKPPLLLFDRITMPSTTQPPPLRDQARIHPAVPA